MTLYRKLLFPLDLSLRLRMAFRMWLQLDGLIVIQKTTVFPHWRLTHTLQLQTTQQHATHLEGSEQGPWGPCRSPRRHEGSRQFPAEGAVAQCPWRTCGTAEGWACAGGGGSSAPSVSGGPPGAPWPHPRNLGDTLGTCRSWNNIHNTILKQHS